MGIRAALGLDARNAVCQHQDCYRNDGGGAVAQEVQRPVDRDCQIAAMLSQGWGNTDNAEMAVERFRQTLIALRKAGGAHVLWLQADPAKQK